MIQRTTRLHKLVRSVGVGSSLSSSSKLRVHRCFSSVAASNAEQACEQSVERTEYKTGAQTVCTQLYSTLVGIQTGHIEDKKGWIVEIE
ncbi:hypothetical protein GBA52_015514 [Prunus armeniaca]|nr:hypothetical protein GBA52_015514 [Prunus armeniaca]